MIESNIIRSEDNLAYVQRAAPNVLLPTNTLNERDSAHLIEINAIYFNLMSKEFNKRQNEIAEERKKIPRAQRITQFSREGYSYKKPKVEDN